MIDGTATDWGEPGTNVHRSPEGSWRDETESRTE
jgi:hypothetical protein